MASSANSSLLLENGQISSRKTMSASEFLTAFPRGAYDVMRTIYHDSHYYIFQYDAHMKRIKDSCEILHIESYDKCEDIIVADMAKALKLFIEQQQEKQQQQQAQQSSSAVAVVQNSGNCMDFKLSVLLTVSIAVLECTCRIFVSYF